MNRILKTAVLSVAVAATTLATLPAANAGERNWRRHHGHHNSRGNDLAVAGILGLAAGALVVGLATSRAAYREPAYREPRPRPDRSRLRRYAAGYDEPRYDYLARSSPGPPTGTTIARTATAASRPAAAPIPATTASSISASPTDCNPAAQAGGASARTGRRLSSGLPPRPGTDCCGARRRSGRPGRGRR